MTLQDLIEAAAMRAGTQAKLAERMGKSPARVSEWKAGKHKPEAGEIVQLAELAGLPPLSTLAEIQAQLDTKHAEIWANALGKLVAAGVAATMILALGLTPDRANAAPSPSQAQPSVCILCKLRCAW